jgi:hypothetical protein
VSLDTFNLEVERMSEQKQEQDPQPVQEGSRWRHGKPSAQEVADWFKLQPLDEGMSHDDYISGVVVIKASEKVKKLKADGRGTEEVWEDTYTPYVRVDTRVTYFRKLAAVRGLIAVIEAVPVPRIEGDGAFANEHMATGFWWHVAGARENAERFVCCTMRVALIHPSIYYHEGSDGISEREGQATKQVLASPKDENQLAKAETGAIGRALGVAGILVVGSGIATAEDMAELRESPVGQTVALPAAVPEESEEQLNERLVVLEGRLRPYTDAWREFAAWWTERAKTSGWKTVGDAPIEARRGVATKIEAMLAELPDLPPEGQMDASPPPQADSSPVEGGS